MKRIAIRCLIAATLVALVHRQSFAQSQPPRSAVQQEYAGSLWDYLQRNGYKNWSSGANPIAFEFGPPVQLNSVASSSLSNDGAVVVTEHYDADTKLVGVTAWRKSHVGYNPATKDWYWAHYTPEGGVVQTSADKSKYNKPGFVAIEDDGYLWVFDINSPELSKVLSGGELAKHTSLLGVGPGGMTVKAPDSETIIRYIAAKPGFHTFVRDDRLWVFTLWSSELEEFLKSGELAKHTTLLGAGPMEMTIRAPDMDTIDAYLYSKPGFQVKQVENRLWVFETGSDELAAFEKDGELAKHVTKLGVGPGGMTMMAPDDQTIAEYIVQAEGFATEVDDDGRLWVFRDGSPEHGEYVKDGELAKHVSRIGEGPGGMTVRAPDHETITAYLQKIGL